ncbi:MAG: Ig-like domain-containing protein [Prevotellaceae bacterium]|jgi:uncharacterized protein YfaS (alpha-2-macroglobulin family)|nr:Ig-like domain-containing protein [Prevotellaceae bacterium]
MKKNSLFSVALFVALIINSCGTKEIVPIEEFTPYIAAYTGGMVQENSTIRIELTEPAAAETQRAASSRLFSFSPKIKGKAFWIDEKTIEFTPKKPLKRGESYTATFRLGKVTKTDKRHKNFVFTFRVEEIGFYARDFNISISEENRVNVAGELVFSAPVPLENVQKAAKFTLTNGQKITPIITAIDAQNFKVEINGIERKEQENKLIISINGKEFGSENSLEHEVIIPVIGVFQVMNAKIAREPETCIWVTFSDNISRSQNLDGLIIIPELRKFNYSLDGNILKIYFETGKLWNLNLTISKNIKNEAGKQMKKDFTAELQIEQLKPQIKFIGDGTILPNAENLKLPFKAVNLRAVDIKIIQIYENNILFFLQQNNLAGNSEIKRVGRLVYKKTMQLNPADGIFGGWHNYAIDLSQMIKKNQGDIYRVVISFKQEYSTYECDDARKLGETAENSANMKKLGDSNEISEKEEQYWDNPHYYYYSYEDYDWENYNWHERENPCHPTYYMVDENSEIACNVLSTNIGVIAKQNEDNKLWVSTADLITANQLSGVEIAAYNFQLQIIGKGTTDADGFCTIENKGKPFALVAKKDNQKTYLRLIDGEENSVSRFDVGGKKLQRGLKGYIYGERGVWRPSDTLHLTFILFDAEKKIPANHPVTFEIYNAQGQFYRKFTSTQGINGFYTFAVPTNENDETGLWRAYAKVGGAVFQKSLRIEAIKPNRLKINLDLGVKRIDAAKKQIPATLSAAWLTGAKASNLQSDIEITLKRAETQFKGYENYNFNSELTDFSESTTSVFKGKIDENGVAKFNLNIPRAENAPAMLNATLTARVMEKGGDASIFAETLPFSPFESYVGLNTNQDKGKYAESGKSQRFDIVTLNADGKPTNRSNIEYKIYKIGWSWWWDNDGENLGKYVNGNSYKPVGSGMLKTENGKANFSFKTASNEWGRYLIYVKDTQSGHAASGIIYFDYPDYYGRSDREDPDGVKMLTFSTDKKSYNTGEKAALILPASAGGRALVSLENGKSVLHRVWIEVKPKQETRYQFEITREMSPNFYIHVSLLQPHSQTVNDLPIRMYGVIPVSVNDNESKLYPVLQTPEVLRPETEFSVKVTEKRGKPMTYTLAIVDDGLLDLTNFKTPNAWNEFYSREALGIRTWDMYDYVIGAFAGKFSGMLRTGGDEDLTKGGQKANRFKPVVKFLGAFTLKSGGTNQHKIKLPMYVGSVRIMAVAGQDGAFGNAEKTLPVRSPLMLLSSLPRTLSVNEEIAVPVNIFAMENDVKNISVNIKTQNGFAKIIGETTQKLNVSKTGDYMVYFHLKTAGLTGNEKIIISSTANGHKAHETIDIIVKNPNPPVIQSVSKLLNGKESAELSYEIPANQPNSWVRLETSRIPDVDISRRFDYLLSYGHYCSEQITSRAFPMLYIPVLKEVTSEESAVLKTNILSAIQSLYSRQNSSGGFLYWGNSSLPDDWITSYIGEFLLKAKEKGYSINEGVLNRWKSYQQRTSRSWQIAETNEYYRENSTVTQAYRLYTLALASAAELGAMNRLKETKNLPPLARWLLAAAYCADGKKNVAQELIFNQPTTYDNHRNTTFGSSIRDEAIVLQTMVALGQTENAFKQAQRISRALNAERYFCTYSTAQALVAMGELAGKTSGTMDYDWTLNGKKQKSIKSPKAVVQTDISQKNGNITLKNNAGGLLYANLVTRYAPLIDTLPATSNNLQIEVKYTDLNGAPINVAQLPQGTDFLAVVRIANKNMSENYTNLALTHIVPSGWEIYAGIDLRVSPTTEGTHTGTPLRYRDIRDDRVLTYFDLSVGKTATFTIRLQAAYAGKFTLPAVSVEAMYDTQARARTRADRVEVVE